ncbi:MAG: hypothetical protein K1X53_10040 [Candidatus Sumerlaeaceae bacterium]|nr:hypothetical protein [Candidatus Sumerlaeaceae bacterium]
MTTEAKQDRTLEGILGHLRSYLSLREQQAIRINPRVANVIDDIAWTQLTNLRMVMEKTRAFGPERLRVADILASDDENKRRSLFHHSDQNSILFEVMNRADDQGKRKVSEWPIHDMRTLFKALDPSLEMIVELIQHWLLWDLPDAADAFVFDEQIARCGYLRSHDLPEEFLGQYRLILGKKADDPVSASEVLQFELARLDRILNHFLARRAEEESFQMIIKRDEETYSAANQEILLIAKHLKALEHVEKSDGPIEQQYIDYYSQSLQCAPDDVTKERMLDFEQRVVADRKKMLHQLLADDRFLGEPYDYKKWQAGQFKTRHAAEHARCEEFLKAHAPQQNVAEPVAIQMEVDHPAPH